MKLLGLVAILFLGALSACQSPASNTEGLVGTWRLITIEAHGTDGSVTRDWGPEPLGLWFFTDTGQMSVQIVDPARRLFESDDFLRPTADELEEAFIGYFGYFGTYTLNESAGEVVFHVEGAAYPNYIGTDQQRFYEIEGDNLTIRTPPERAGDADVTYEARLERQS
jgi:hypothetical protein